MKAIWTFLQSEEGPTAVEYAVMLALIVVGCLTAISTLGSATSDSFEYAQDQINSAIAGS